MSNPFFFSNDGILKSLVPSQDIPKFSTFDNQESKLDGKVNLFSDVPKFTENLEHYPTINERYEGKCHPDSGVKYERDTIVHNGELKEGVFPVFDEKFEAELPSDLCQSTDAQQFKECNHQLKDWCDENPEEAAKRFSKDDLEFISAGEKPEGYTWHHHQSEGRMQLIDSSDHDSSRHTGGKAIWGGGSENR
ncbi:HNH endonuclease [Photobacterium iliopiscarium]|uniref:HNH endonuclease n=1 Tax=Photobacterium iliopiscarium TaxID=56192 RepID=UPI00242FC404|nr:HNH endonuclease [Photobacterium iliopiscarium]